MQENYFKTIPTRKSFSHQNLSKEYYGTNATGNTNTRITEVSNKVTRIQLQDII